MYNRNQCVEFGGWLGELNYRRERAWNCSEWWKKALVALMLGGGRPSRRGSIHR